MHLGFPPPLTQFCTSQEANLARHPERTTSRERWTDPHEHDMERFLWGAVILFITIPVFLYLFWPQALEAEKNTHSHKWPPQATWREAVEASGVAPGLGRQKADRASRDHSSAEAR
jgi:hypothetical protein